MNIITLETAKIISDKLGLDSPPSMTTETHAFFHAFFERVAQAIVDLEGREEERKATYTECRYFLLKAMREEYTGKVPLKESIKKLIEDIKKLE